MSMLGPQPVALVRLARRAAGMLTGLTLVAAGLAGTVPARDPGRVIVRLGPVTVAATALSPGPADTLTAAVRVRTSGRLSDQLDAAIAAGGVPVAIYHEQVSIGEIPDLGGCGTVGPSPRLVDHWLHTGPLLVPGRSGGRAPPADATLTVPPGASLSVGATLAVTLYFAHAGSVVLRLPVSPT